MSELCGKIIGQLVVVKEAPPYISPKGYRTEKYLCMCACGKITVVRKDRLEKETTTSCGCKRTQDNIKMKWCAFLPYGVECSELACTSCGWNPHNEALREKRIKKIKIKAGLDYDNTDETEPAAENS